MCDPLNKSVRPDRISIVSKTVPTLSSPSKSIWEIGVVRISKLGFVGNRLLRQKSLPCCHFLFKFKLRLFHSSVYLVSTTLLQYSEILNKVLFLTFVKPKLKMFYSTLSELVKAASGVLLQYRLHYLTCLLEFEKGMKWCLTSYEKLNLRTKWMHFHVTIRWDCMHHFDQSCSVMFMSVRWWISLCFYLFVLRLAICSNTQDRLVLKRKKSKFLENTHPKWIEHISATTRSMWQIPVPKQRERFWGFCRGVSISIVSISLGQSKMIGWLPA